MAKSPFPKLPPHEKKKCQKIRTNIQDDFQINKVITHPLIQNSNWDLCGWLQTKMAKVLESVRSEFEFECQLLLNRVLAHVSTQGSEFE